MAKENQEQQQEQPTQTEITGFVNAKSDAHGGIRVEHEWYNTHDETLKHEISKVNKGDYVKLGLVDGKLVSVVVDDKTGDKERKAYDWKASLVEKKEWMAECKTVVEEIVGNDKSYNKAELVSTLFISLERRK